MPDPIDNRSTQNPYASTNDYLLPSDSISPEVDPEAIRRLHLSHEVSVKSIGTLNYLGAFIMLMVGGLYVVLAFATIPTPPNQPEQLKVWLKIWFGIFGGVILVFAIITGVVAYGLRRLQPWARIASGVLNAIGLLAFPVGTVISAYFLWLLFSAKGEMVFSGPYKSVIAATPHIRYRTPIVIWIILAILIMIPVVGLCIAAIV